MCGITGFYSINKNISHETLRQITTQLTHRGPEFQSEYYLPHIGLGHRRLKIIDLSDAANQPMISKSGKLIIVFNGEIYNFQEIKARYQIQSQTNSDTEILLEAFEKKGPQILSELNGMFALAIYNTVNKKLFIARDRIGIKPLFYFWNGKDLVFASELKALTKVPLISKSLKINHSILNDFLHLGYIPEPNTIYQNIYKFPSGDFAWFDGQKLSVKSYWTLKDQIQPTVLSDFTEAKKQLKNLITNSVKHRLISDVPFGTFLSGGIDSSLVTAVAQSVSSEKIKTFSIGFKESKFNEAIFANKVAKHLKTEHHEFIVSENEAKELIETIIDSYDEPFADTSAIPTMLVSQMARKHVTMTLSGDGGDELFHGYGSYLWNERLNKMHISTFRKIIALSLKTQNSRYKRIANLFEYQNKAQLKSHIFSQEQYNFSQKEISTLLEKNTTPSIEENYENLARELTPAEQQALFDLHYYLKDDLLTKVDRASMKYSLETRVPLLDHNIVTFALNLDPKLKIKNGIQKYLLKELLYDYAPKQLFDRPKWGFSIPLEYWLKTDLKYLIDKYLNKATVEQFGLFKYSQIQELLTRYFSGKEDYLYQRIWLLIILHQFLLKTA